MFVAKCINEAIRVGAFAQQLRTSTEPIVHRQHRICTSLVQHLYRTSTIVVQNLYSACTADAERIWKNGEINVFEAAIKLNVPICNLAFQRNSFFNIWLCLRVQ